MFSSYVLLQLCDIIYVFEKQNIRELHPVYLYFIQIKQFQSQNNILLFDNFRQNIFCISHPTVHLLCVGRIILELSRNDPQVKTPGRFSLVQHFSWPQTVIEIAIPPVFIIHKTNAVEINLTYIKVAVHCLAHIPPAEVRNHICNSMFIKYRAMQKKTVKKVHSKNKDQVDIPIFLDFTPCH